MSLCHLIMNNCSMIKRFKLIVVKKKIKKNKKRTRFKISHKNKLLLF